MQRELINLLERQDKRGLLLGHFGLESALVKGFAHGSDTASGAAPCDETCSALVFIVSLFLPLGALALCMKGVCGIKDGVRERNVRGRRRRLRRHRWRRLRTFWLWLNVAGEVLAMRAAEVLPSDEIGRRGLFRSENVVMRIVRGRTGGCKLIITPKKKEGSKFVNLYICIYSIPVFTIIWNIYLGTPFAVVS